MTNKMMIVVLVISAAVFSSWPVQAADEPNDRVCKEEGRVLTERELIDRYLFTDKVDRLGSVDIQRNQMTEAAM